MADGGEKEIGMALTAKQQRFAQEYLIDLNATQAAIRAGYSERSAYSQAHDLLKKPEVAAAITEARAERAQRTQVEQDDVIDRLLREADREGDGASHAARVTAIHLLGRHIGMFRDRVEHSASNELLEAARALCATAEAVKPGTFSDDGGG